jgi:hypothetical protein
MDGLARLFADTKERDNNGLSDLGFGEKLLENKQTKLFKIEYGDLLEKKIWYSKRGRQIFMRVPCFGRELKPNLILKNLIELYKIDRRICRVSLQMAFCIQNLRTRKTKFFYPSCNTAITNRTFFYIRPSNIVKSFRVIKAALDQAYKNDYMNEITMRYAESSESSQAIPFYLLYVGLLMPRNYR